MFCTEGPAVGWTAIRFTANNPCVVACVAWTAVGKPQARGRCPATGAALASIQITYPLPPPLLKFPGVWPLHCHITPHQAMGQAVNLIVEPNKAVAPPKDLPQCAKVRA